MWSRDSIDPNRRQLSIEPAVAFDPPMRTVLQSWQIFVAAMAGWPDRGRRAAVEHRREQNRVC